MIKSIEFVFPEKAHAVITAFSPPFVCKQLIRLYLLELPPLSA